MEQKKAKALHSLGIEAVSCIQEQMESGYSIPFRNRDSRGKPIGGTHTDIRDTSNLIGSIQFKKINDNSIIVGTNIEYGTYIHEGTRFIPARPFIKDGILNNMDRLRNAIGSEFALNYGGTKHKKHTFKRIFKRKR